MSKPKVPPWPHYVDEENKTVWIHVDSWMKAQAAPHLVRKYFGPDYKHKLSSLEKINEQKESS